MKTKSQNKIAPSSMTATFLALAILGAALAIAAPAAASTRIETVGGTGGACIGASTGGNCYGYYQPRGIASQGTCVGLYVSGHCTGVQL